MPAPTARLTLPTSPRRAFMPTDRVALPLPTPTVGVPLPMSPRRASMPTNPCACSDSRTSVCPLR